MIGGRVALNAPGIAQGLPHVNGGKVVALGVTGSKRAPGAPEIPTIAEQGVPGYEFYGWHGIFAPSNTPPEVVAGTSEEFAEFLRSDFAKWQTLFNNLGMKPE